MMVFKKKLIEWMKVNINVKFFIAGKIETCLVCELNNFLGFG